jgi:NarL family two-component system sensor histidine kinase YdfH
MTNKLPSEISKVERDPRLFMWFLTLVVAGMYSVTLVNKPAVRQIEVLLPFTVLIIIHIILHWQIEKISKYQSKALWYTIIQGVLVLVISWLAGDIGIIYALFMGLIGEAVGLFGLTRQGLLAGLYYLILLAISQVQRSGWDSSGLLLLGTIPMVVFVVIYVTLYMRQNEAREKAQALAAELERANQQLSEYAAQVEDLTIANERQRMARELHDTLSQGLAGLILQLEAADAHLSNHRNEKAQSIVGDAMVQARAALADARRAIDDLRQSSLDDLDAALRLEISRFTNATGIPILYHADQTPPLPAPVTETLIRAVAEALTNVANHAHAHNVAVDVRMKDKSLSVSIQDDGQGFDAAAIPAGHYGILGIKERIRLVNGNIEIQSENGKGTTLKIEIPT